MLSLSPCALQYSYACLVVGANGDTGCVKRVLPSSVAVYSTGGAGRRGWAQEVYGFTLSFTLGGAALRCPCGVGLARGVLLSVPDIWRMIWRVTVSVTRHSSHAVADIV